MDSRVHIGLEVSELGKSVESFSSLLGMARPRFKETLRASAWANPVRSSRQLSSRLGARST